MKPSSKTIHEAFSRFFEAPTRESFRTLLREHVGELRNCDFKESWPDAPALARHILALGNAGGGALILGVAENPDKSSSPVGLLSILDKANFSNGQRTYLPPSLLAAIEIADFKFEASEYPKLVGKIFQVVFVHPRPDSTPFVAQRSGTGIRAAAIYIRREGQSEEANHDEIQRLIEERLAAAPQTVEARNLKEHLEELKVLYAEVPLHRASKQTIGVLADAARMLRFIGASTEPNPDYPAEGYEAFVLRMIRRKKELIEERLGGSNAT